MTRKESNYSIVIHTDSYAGNFERALRGYVTGCEGEHDHGWFHHEIREKFAGTSDCDWEELDEDENPYSGLWKRVQGEYGWRIEELAVTPNLYCSKKGVPNSVRLHCETKPTKKQLELVKEWALKFAENSKCPKPSDRYERKERQKNPFWFIQPINILGFTLECDKVVTVHAEENF
jgi:hypothetical protein